jgi:hypothetical protein
MEHNDDNSRRSQIHRLGQPLGYSAARRANPALVSAAEAYFGTWDNALYAAGIDPNLHLRGKWRKRRMIAKRDHTRFEGRGLAA